MSKARRPRGLDADDRALWDAVKATIKPLQSRKSEVESAEANSELPRARTPAPTTSVSRPPASPKPVPPLAALDRRMRQRLVRGRAEIDGRLDLHGLTLERAWLRLRRFLATAQDRGDSLILVITGKGAGGRGDGVRGALRREVPHWLARPELRPFVIGFEEAAPRHGGAGALYVRIRRA